MEPFQWHLKTHWKCLLPIANPMESEDDTTRGVVAGTSKHATWRISPLQGTQKLVFTGCGAHLQLKSQGGVWTPIEIVLLVLAL